MGRLIVAGSGFAGIRAVELLSSLCLNGYDCLWISPSGTFTFQPLLPAVAAGRLEAGDVAWSLESFARRKGFQLVKGAVELLGDGYLVLDSGERLEFDYAIICLGSTPNFYGVPGAEEYARTFYTLEDAIAVRERLRRGDTFIIVGGGPVGVELAGELASAGSEVYLVEMLPQPLALLGNRRASNLAEEELKRRGVRLILGKRVVRVLEGGVELENGEVLACENCTVVWTAGVKGPSIRLERREPLAKHGFLEVDETLKLRGYTRVYAAGDCTYHKLSCPPLKVVREALRMAAVASKNVMRRIASSEKQGKYRPLVTTCRPLLAVCIRNECIMVLGRRIALRTKLPAKYHERLRGIYARKLA